MYQDEWSSNDTCICTFFTDKLNCECAQNAANSFAKFEFIALGEEGGEWGVGGSLVSSHPAKCLVPLPPSPPP